MRAYAKSRYDSDPEFKAQQKRAATASYQRKKLRESTERVEPGA